MLDSLIHPPILIIHVQVLLIMLQTPGVAVVHSGGGFRGMMATCGVFKGLHKAGLLDLITYMSGLSGSTW